MKKALLFSILVMVGTAPLWAQTETLTDELRNELLLSLEEEDTEEEVYQESAGLLVKNEGENSFRAHKLRQLFQQIDVPEQTFTFQNPKKGGSFSGKKGYTVSFPPNAFTDFEGNPVNEPVKVTLKEYDDISEMLSGNLNTHAANGTLLETGGMIYLNVETKKGKKLKLAKGKAASLQIVGKGSNLPYMQYFRQDRKTSIWLPTKRTKKFFQHPYYQKFLYFSRLQGNSNPNFPEPNIRPYAPLEVQYDSYMKRGKKRYKVRVTSLAENLKEHCAAIEARLQFALELPEKKPVNYTMKGGLNPLLLHFNPEDLDKMRAQLKAEPTGKRKAASRFSETIYLAAHYRQYALTYQEVLNRYTNQVQMNYQALDSLSVLQQYVKGLFAYCKGSDSTYYRLHQDYLTKGVEAYLKKYKEEYQKMKDNYGTYAGFYAKQVRPVMQTVTRLGLINCDRFLNDERPKTELIVQSENKSLHDSLSVSYKIIFKNYRSLMEGMEITENKANFQGLPIGEEVVLVALGTDGQNNFYASKELKIGQNEVIDLPLEAVSIKELKQKIKQWDKL